MKIAEYKNVFLINIKTLTTPFLTKLKLWLQRNGNQGQLFGGIIMKTETKE